MSLNRDDGDQLLKNANYMKSGLRVGLKFDDGHEDHDVGVDDLLSSIMCLPNGNW